MQKYNINNEIFNNWVNKTTGEVKRYLKNHKLKYQSKIERF